jgi:predicted RND superfamily exporter protein/outer membrane lipoprotein-sorting protein
MKIEKKLIDLSARHPRTVIVVAVLMVLALGMQIPRLTVDTDPENMLPADEASRVFHGLAKKEFALHDMIVVGVVNERDPDGVFNPTSLARIHDLTHHIEAIDGVIRHDLMSLSSVDNIGQGGPGVVRFEWMMPEPPQTREEAHAVRDAARRLPTIDGTLVSEDGRAAGIYVPIAEKKESHRIASEIERFIAGFEGDERYFITGLPVAEETFGVEMFKQMGIAAPMAGLLIFLLMLLFFRSLSLITAPMIVAIITVTATMGLLIGMRFTVHIMSSMIPIFLMPIAVVDSIHILSEFADIYPRIGDRRKAIRLVMADLYQPMHYTSLTSAVGFLSLVLAPIPPVRVFGAFVAFGIMLAFYLTITFIPAYIVLISDERLARLGRRNPEADKGALLSRLLGWIGPRALARSKVVLAVSAVVAVLSAWGISQIQINDNPVRWFRPSHRIRVADRVLNQHFAGTYNAFLVLKKAPDAASDTAARVRALLEDAERDQGVALTAQWDRITGAGAASDFDREITRLIDAASAKLDEAGDAEAFLWEDALVLLEEVQTAGKYFQDPVALRYIEGLQDDMARSDLVGKSTSLADIVKTVHRELREGSPDYYSVPGTAPAVAQTLLSYQSSHRPHDLWHFVTPDFRSANLWLQLKSGDNQDMTAVKAHVERYLEANPLPGGVTLDWAGLTYLNVVWQEQMVSGMLNALLGSFVIVFLMMLVLFRSVWFGLLAMLPLSITIAFIYGLIGFLGKDYDMPIAVLSALTLGLSVDFAIHFLQRTRAVFHETGNWKETVRLMFNEPARAITRNAIVISVGFLPMLASPLVPYNTVGFFLAAIMVVSALVTLFLLPAVINQAKGRIFRGHAPDEQEHEFSTEAGRKALKDTTVAAVLLATIVTTAQPARSQENPPVDQIIDRANRAAYYAGDDGRAEVRMTIVDEQGRERVRQFTILRKDREEGGDQDYAVLFSRPADVRNTVFLVKKHVGGDDDRWLYLPGLDLVKRIAAGDKRTSFVGSHFFYEDVSGRSIEEDTHELVVVTGDHFIVKNTPRDKSSVEFAQWTVWIDKKTYVPMKMEYTDERGQVYRRIEALEVQDVAGHPTATQMKVSDLRAGGYTLSQFRNIKYDLGVPDDVFTERTLRNPPQEWFRGR